MAYWISRLVKCSERRRGKMGGMANKVASNKAVGKSMVFKEIEYI